MICLTNERRVYLAWNIPFVYLFSLKLVYQRRK